MNDFLIQCIGYVAVVAYIISFQIKSNRALFFFQTIGSALFVLQFFLMDAMTGSLNLLIGLSRNLMLVKYNQWAWVRKGFWKWVYTAALTAVLIFSWGGPLSLLPFIGSVASTFSFYTNNARTIRVTGLLCVSPCWLVYDMAVGSWGGVITETISLASVIVSILRFGWKALGDDPEFANK